jgi:polyhydroxybutyrate depolymerase
MKRAIVAAVGVAALGVGLTAAWTSAAPGASLTSAAPGASLTTPAPGTRAIRQAATPPAAPTTATPPAAPPTATPPATTIDYTDPPPPVPDPCTTPVAGAGGDQDIDLTIDGYRRSFRLYVPGPLAAGRRLPVVVALHGFRDSGQNMERYSGLSVLASRDGFIVAYPNAYDGAWAIHSRGPRGNADLDLVRATLGYAETHYCVDRTRVFAAGVSNGGGEVSRIACALANRFTAVAIVAGDYRDMPPCDPQSPVSVFDIHATSDPIVPYLGAGATHDGSVPRFLALWRSLDRCRVPGAHSRVNPDAVRARWSCADATMVGQLRLTHGGHFWPGGTMRASKVPAVGSAGAEIWDFFSALPPRDG